MTNFKPDQTSFTAQTFTSTKPNGKASSRITSPVISVGSLEAFFGQETHTTASDLMTLRRLSSSAFRQAFLSLKTWTISVDLDTLFSNKTPGGHGRKKLNVAVRRPLDENAIGLGDAKLLAERGSRIACLSLSHGRCHRISAIRCYMRSSSDTYHWRFRFNFRPAS